MRKYSIILAVLFIFICVSILSYLSFYGIKTNKFNNLIYTKINQINPKLKAEINNVYLQLDIRRKSIHTISDDVILSIDGNKLFLDKIKSSHRIFDFINSKNSIQNFEISTNEANIQDLKKFITAFNFNLKRELILNQIKKGKIKAKINLDFKNETKNYDFNIKGEVINGQINFLNKLELFNISCDFLLNQDQYFLNNLNFKFENTDFFSKNISAKKLGNNYSINGDISNKKQLINFHKLAEISNFNPFFLKKKNIEFSSKNIFSFNIINKKKFDNFNIKSKINFDEIEFIESLNLPFNLRNGDLEMEYKNRFTNININSKYYFIDNEHKQSNLGNAKFLITKQNQENFKININFDNTNNKINTEKIKKIFDINTHLIPNQEITFDSINILSFELNKKNKIEKYDLKSDLKINNLKIIYNGENLTNILPEYKGNLFTKDNSIKINLNEKLKKISFEGIYTIDEKLFNKYKIDLNKNLQKINFETNISLDNLFLKLKNLEYIKNKSVVSDLSFKGRFHKNLIFDFIKFQEDQNNISINNLNLSKNLRIKSIDVLNINIKNSKNHLNNLNIEKNDNKYKISSNLYDAELLISNYLNGDKSDSFLKRFEKLNTEIYVESKKILIGSDSALTNLNGSIIIKDNKINSAKIYSKINKKNDFSLLINSNSKDEKITNLFIDKPEPFIKNLKYIKGFNEGKLSYGSIEKNNQTAANLKIYNFKIKEIPILAKILTLASLQGVADLLTGEGIRFNEFEMDYLKNNSYTEIKEMYAIGPAISILMEGYIEKNKLTSLRGTLVPATTINKTISKIPLLGDILVGKKVGEGIFGVSFKIKGPPENLKTSVNPIKTLTPRFITRTLEMIKK